MIMDDKKLTAQESLEVITSMINRTKERYFGNGNIFLLWGYLVTLVAITVWILLCTTGNQFWNWIWFAIPIIGYPLTILISRKDCKRNGAITYSDKITSSLWTIFGISELILTLICLIFSLFMGVDCWIALLVYSILMAPSAEIAQGLIIKENSLVFGGIIGLMAGIITVCCVSGGIPLSVNWYMPLFIIAWASMMIIPGYMLNLKFKNLDERA